MSALFVWVQHRVVGGDVYVMAPTAYHARVRVHSLTRIAKPLVQKVAAEVRKLRCGQVGVDVAFVVATQRYMACVTTGGRRHFVDNEGGGDFECVAREALRLLVEAKDVDEGLMLWKREGDEDHPHVVMVPS